MDLADWVSRAAGRFAAAGVPSPRVDAEVLAAHVLDLSRGATLAAAITGRRLSDPELARLEALAAERALRVPLQHLTGRAPFCGFELAVGPGVFVPRPETEIAVETALAELDGRSASARPASGAPVVADLCSGSGAIAIAVARQVPGAIVLAVEVDPLALAWAARNVATLAPSVHLEAGDVLAEAVSPVLTRWSGRVDVLIANPPYIPELMRPREPEVAEHDPELALYGGGRDGLQVPGAVIVSAVRLLRPGGLLIMEHAETQGEATRKLCAPGDWSSVGTLRDLTGRDRVLVARRVVPR